MFLYLPIAEIPVNVLLFLGMGAAVGFLSGMFGVGGGFLMTPLLIFTGIPPAVAVATGANQIVGTSFAGARVHLKRKTIDFKLGTLLLAGGIVGSSIGIFIFSYLRSLGQLDLIISLSYVGFLGVIGTLMLYESIGFMLRSSRAAKTGRLNTSRVAHHNWIHGLPFKMRFKRSKLYISAIPVLVIGALVGILAAIMGVGGGFIMVPAMIYLLRVPTNVVIGTSLYQILFVTIYTTIVQAGVNHTVDVTLAFILLVGGVIGAQYGARASQRLKGEQLRALLALMVIGVAGRLAFELIATPSELYSIAFSGPR